ncbi:unnamed protein product [Clonostachys byssicola]|uniref:AB hydrolase-1 domain-containing protein n=1 Tax=Clonostachys byssicola TaxID=160290 RepID=A0A9N9Y1R8_9HYPO|nr:unnamed protein product [Clonostachys byssicola]
MRLSIAFQATAWYTILSNALCGTALAAASWNSTLSHFTTTDGTTYAYDFNPASGSNTTFLFLHGYPSSHKDWEYQIAALNAAGFGTLAPDMLGFGASDMPTDPHQYRAKRLSNHLAELLDHKALDTVIGVGHDWGSVILSRLAAYHPDRFEKFVFVNVGHQAPGGFVDIDALNSMFSAEYGYTPYGYWYFFDRYDAGAVIKTHLESFWHLVFPENHTIWVEHLAPISAARSWLEAETKTYDPSFLSAAYKSDWLAWMSRPNATESGLNCYRSQLRGINDADESTLKTEDWELHVPVLAIGGSLDPIGRADLMVASTQPWALGGFETKTLDSGHWTAQELPNEVNELLLEFAIKDLVH